METGRTSAQGSEPRPAVLVEGLCKRYRSVEALDRVSFRIDHREVFGLLGPNGAGKSTAIKILATMARPSRGQAWVDGWHVLRQHAQVRRSIGVVFQEPSLDDRLSARENLDFHARMYGMDRDLRGTRMKELLDLVDLGPRADSRVSTFSGGMKRRLEIARGLMHHPRVLFLDEPTLGLDARSRRQIWDHIRQLNRERGVTVVLSTHYMEEADALCDRIAILDRGRIAALGRREELKAMVGRDILRLCLSHASHGVIESLEAQPWVSDLEVTHLDLRMRVSEEGQACICRLLELLAGHESQVRSLSLDRPTLEDVFLELTGSSLNGEQVPTSAETLLQRLRRWLGRG